MKANKTLNVQEPMADATVWNALCALAVGGLLGSAVMLCSLWIQDALWCTALQSVGSALVLALPIHFRSRNVSLDLWSQALHLETEPGERQGRQESTEWNKGTAPGLVAL